MPSEHVVQIERLRAWTRRVVRPAAVRDVAPLTVRAWAAPGRVPPDAAMAADAAGDFTPVEVGWRWGPPWSTCWFRLDGTVPAAWADDPVWLRFSSGTEALAWRVDAAGGPPEPRHGFDSNRSIARLTCDGAADSGGCAEGGAGEDSRAWSGATWYVEAACNHWFGVTAFAWDPPETQARWESDTPGHLQAAELVRAIPAAWQLAERLDFACDLLAALDAEDIRARRVRDGLAALIRAVDPAHVGRDAARWLDHLDAVLEEAGPEPSRTSAIAAGHAHIDTAWLWPLEETRRKCLRSFANALDLIDRHPTFRFSCSQPQQYAWVQKDAPGLFARIEAAVADGRWEPVGASWIEFDANLPSGESLVRQVLFGHRYFAETFGTGLPQHVLFLPDTFGFPGSLPQIMAGAGLDLFVTNKLAWNRRTPFPFVSFRWRGIDGTEVLGHCTPGGDYNARLTVEELRRAERRLAEGEGGMVPVWLQPFGYGDGGGGPDDAMLERGRQAARLPALPDVQPGTMHAFRDRLREAADALPPHGPHALPTWTGGIALELHRGTFTTHGRLKQLHRRCEVALRTVEWLTSALPIGADPAVRPTPDRLDAVWRTLLLNQFHDILPGTSIREVGERSLADLQEVYDEAEAMRRDLARGWAAASARTSPDATVLLNPSAWDRSEVVEVDGRAQWSGTVPGLGMATHAPADDGSHPRPAAPPAVTIARAAPAAAATAAADATPATEPTDALVLDNGRVRVVCTADGAIHTLTDHRTGRDIRRPGGDPLGALVLYDDRPYEWDAWEIDPEHAERALSVHEIATVTGPTVHDDGPWRIAATWRLDLGDLGSIDRTVRLDAGSAFVELDDRVDWHASHRLLRMRCDVDVAATDAIVDIAFGCERRPITRNGPVERMQFEVCAHQWVAQTEPGFGVAVVNDGRFGWAVEGSRIEGSMLRAPRHPDPTMDRGVHRMVHAIGAFGGPDDLGSVVEAAARINDPLLVVERAAGDDPAARGSGAGGASTADAAPYRSLSVHTSGPAKVDVVAWKPAADGDGDGTTIVRLVERVGGRGHATLVWPEPPARVEPVDLLERPTGPPLPLDPDGRLVVPVRPFGITSLRVTRQ